MRQKYGNKKTGGYASKKEANYAQHFKLMERAGTISDLQEQVKFEVLPAQRCGRIERAIHYVADFVYVDDKGKYHVVDVKGMRTPIYIIKRKLMLYVHKIVIEEV